MRDSALLLVALGFVLTPACSDVRPAFDPDRPARGPGQLVGNGEALTDGKFPGGFDSLPQARAIEPPDDALPPDCGPDCLSHCDKAGLNNPVNKGLCTSTWGVGLDLRPIDETEACRRLFVDLVGRFPSLDEVEATCSKDWGQVVQELMSQDAFVLLQQRRWADKLLYNNQVVSIERIFDMDDLVGKLYRGRVAYDQFAAVLSAHPVVTRRYSTAADQAEAVFEMLLGRPPYANERADLARLYTLWGNGYYDHPVLQARLPDATIDYRCITDEGTVDEGAKGECTSVLWGYNELILIPDLRATEGEMWSGLLRPDEWEKLQLPGRILSSEVAFWEKAVDDVLEQYLGYELGTLVPEVRHELVRFLLEHQGDIRSVHFAVLTSAAYLQSAQGDTERHYRWLYGPLRQVEVEPWIDTVTQTTGFRLSACDHRLSRPEDVLNTDTLSGFALVDGTNWQLDEEGDLMTDYRDLARTLGGCPDNEIGGRFKAVSILTTAAQEAFVTEVCNPGLESRAAADLDRLLPGGTDANKALDANVASAIWDHQSKLFLGRAATAAEKARAQQAADQCTPKPCTAEMFARPACFALLASAEMLFY